MPMLLTPPLLCLGQCSQILRDPVTAHPRATVVLIDLLLVIMLDAGALIITPAKTRGEHGLMDEKSRGNSVMMQWLT